MLVGDRSSFVITFSSTAMHLSFLASFELVNGTSQLL